MARITPRILKGFRDYLPDATIARQEMIRTLQDVFSSFGFAPIDTPALEYAEILLGKGSDETDRQLYRFHDQGGRDIALRFDLTVPLARYSAMHANELGVPFKRFHIAPVWRAEKPQRGRYREFLQCDFDVIGTKEPYSDAEIVAVMNASFKALNINHRVKINNRGILNGLLDQLGAREKSVAVLRAIDKMDKLGKEVVEKELSAEANLDASQIENVFGFLALSDGNPSSAEMLSKLKDFFKENQTALEGVAELDKLCSFISAFEISDDDFAIDLGIARGLDYYTGTVFETECSDLPEIGSICSGGRYNDLASLYTKQELPGVGASIGLDRTLAALEELGRIAKRDTPARALVTITSEETQGLSIKASQVLRAGGVPTETFLQPKKLAAQLKHANRRGIRFVILATDEQLADSICSVKDMENGEQKDNVPFEKLAETIIQLEE